MDGTGDPEGSLPAAWFSIESEAEQHKFYSTADVVVNTLPLSAATDKFVGKQAFASMKTDAVFANIGRGKTVDQEALVAALHDKEGGIGGATLDVTDPEPLPEGHVLFSLENVILSPHTSGASVHYFTLAVDLLKAQAERLRAGKGALNAWRGRGED